MAFNFYDTHTLLASVQQLPPLHSFLLDRYFPTNAACWWNTARDPRKRHLL